MRFLLFLLLGTLVFGFAFPAFILIVGLFVLILLGLILFSFVTGAFGGRNVTIYTTKRTFDPYAGRQEQNHPGDPEVFGGTKSYPDESDTIDFGEDAEAEVVELPASALRKEDDDA